MKLSDILKIKDFPIDAKVKLVRHQSSEYDLQKLYREGFLDEYQSIQSKNVFKGCDYIISFLGLDGSFSKFIGIYKVNGTRFEENPKWSSKYIYPDMGIGNYIYNLEYLGGYEDLVDSLIIDWGLSTRSWHQHLKQGDKDKTVIEIKQKGYTKAFKGFLDFILDYEELCQIVKNPMANKEWHTMLSSVAGIYLIVDSQTGNQYVGSAYGKEGILGRWKNYVANGHGGNKELKELCSSSSSYPKSFQFTILHTLPKSLTHKEVIAYETLFKNKLGSRAFGLNLN